MSAAEVPAARAGRDGSGCMQRGRARGHTGGARRRATPRNLSRRPGPRKTARATRPVHLRSTGPKVPALGPKAKRAHAARTVDRVALLQVG
eukprot:CAMPEP_0206049414 /NCGR_PEP_ID=MMETSP1466-20131121/26719_1 /ASSEMBLY_ACC=CAM_ASM_001126 /TAXON_ID=44452 /ORGANISM="Pavlova gyrans, Strain CCMP608" /LENGTH=90 /DNA_ID=CAMNT_0053424497 /DNA_START=27 /DNA_END=296 /DNA_ORIENTATION=-